MSSSGKTSARRVGKGPPASSLGFGLPFFGLLAGRSCSSSHSSPPANGTADAKERGAADVVGSEAPQMRKEEAPQMWERERHREKMRCEGQRALESKTRARHRRRNCDAPSRDQSVERNDGKWQEEGKSRKGRGRGKIED